MWIWDEMLSVWECFLLKVILYNIVLLIMKVTNNVFLSGKLLCNASLHAVTNAVFHLLRKSELGMTSHLS